MTGAVMFGRWRRARRGARSLDAALAGVGLAVAAPPLGHLARVTAVPSLGPSPAFRLQLRERLVAAAQEAP